MIRMTRTPDKGWSRVSIVEFIVENNVEYVFFIVMKTFFSYLFSINVNKR